MMKLGLAIAMEVVSWRKSRLFTRQEVASLLRGGTVDFCTGYTKEGYGRASYGADTLWRYWLCSRCGFLHYTYTGSVGEKWSVASHNNGPCWC
jgi:hypothetical protein